MFRHDGQIYYIRQCTVSRGYYVADNMGRKLTINWSDKNEAKRAFIKDWESRFTPN